MSDGDPFDRAIAAIDAANAGDPHRLVVDGEERPKELAHAELMTRWVRRLDPDASEAQLLAARAHHLRRWAVPRRDYPTGRTGYLRWRSELAKRHAAEASELLAVAGYDDGMVSRVSAIIRKQRRTSDRAVQVHEDALCLVFLETQLSDLVAKLGNDKTADVVAKTMLKMSPAGLDAAASIDLGPEGVEILEAALSQLASRTD